MEADDRLGGSLALALEAARRGARMVRVHDVRETVQAIASLHGRRDRVDEVIERTLGFREYVGDYQRQLFLVDHAGLPLKTVLDEAGLQSGAKWIVAEGADAAALSAGPARSLKALEPQDQR